MNDLGSDEFDALAIPMLLEVNRLCRDFELAVRAGQSPRIEDFVGRIGEKGRAAALRELIVLQVDLFRAAGQAAEPEEFHRRFPQHTQTVNAAFVLIKGRRPATALLPDTASLCADNGPEADRSTKNYRGESDNTSPERLGRFKIEREIGRGAFGVVYLAQDGELGRQVALKVPRLEQFSSPEEMNAVLNEAHTAAQLTHPGIVAIYDVGRDGEQVFIVQEFINGRDLGKFLRAHKPTPSLEQTARMMMAIAEAVAFAHTKGFVHRDLKPANILLDMQQRPRVADFGLAMHETVQRRRRGDRSGTPEYMSPEQVRGETHRLDGRSDIWSLGVMLYEMLAGRRPFGGDSRSELDDEIQHRDPTPPRQIEQHVPEELQSICLKCLSKRVTDRYHTALDLANDLQHWLASSQQPLAADSASHPVQVVPKGLRSFDAGDAGFFLELLPGPRDRDRLPESIRFWKARMEDTDADRTFAVGLLYGPSGCGKSSLMKAGLLPRLASHVLPVYAEATAEDTEVRILKGLRKACPAISVDTTLPEVFAALREGAWFPRGKKIVLVLDQFEQWLHARTTGVGEQLIQALRQCDGGRLQAIVLVRDDFAMAAARFMDSLDISIVQGHNFATVDLFDVEHAQKVLTKFGQAFGKLPAQLSIPSEHEREFVRAVATGLAQDGRVVSVRLALFAEMVKGKPWLPATLAEVGGTEGIGVNFLEESFVSRSANPKHRQHQQAARHVLEALLPEVGTDIKGHMRSHAELLAAAGCQQRPGDFQDLLRILDAELRLITPTDPESLEANSASDPSSKYYQLTHDYLVPSLRDWLTRKRKETASGCAELLLEERVATWRRKPEARQLPSFWEMLTIWYWTRGATWTVAQRTMMQHAWRFHGIRATAVLVLTVSVLFALSQAQKASRKEQARILVAAFLGCPADAVPLRLEKLKPLRKEALTILREEFQERDPTQELRAALAFAAFGAPDVYFLLDSIALAPTGECANVVAAFQADRHITEIAQRELLDRVQDEAQPPARRVRFAATLLHLGDPRGTEQVLKITLDNRYRTEFIHAYARWHGSLTDLKDVLLNHSQPEFQSGLCLALGNIGDERRQEFSQLIGVLQELHELSSDGAVHSAAEWALRRWNLPLSVPIGPATPPTGRRWWRNSAGITFVRIPAGTVLLAAGTETTDVPREPVKSIVKQPFWISTTEVTVRWFQAFLDDNATEDKPSSWAIDSRRCRSVNSPVHKIAREDAFKFCNWLSRNANLEECYLRTTHTIPLPKSIEETVYEWELRPQANGYRLPTFAEWEIAARAGTNSAFPFGDLGQAPRLGHYAWFSGNSLDDQGKHLADVGLKMPNDFGLFDMLGNVEEMVWDRPFAIPSVDDSGSGKALRVAKGGSIDSTPSGCLAGTFANCMVNYRVATLGMRVVLSDEDKTPVADVP